MFLTRPHTPRQSSPPLTPKPGSAPDIYPYAPIIPSSQAMEIGSVFYSRHTVAAWACLTSVARIYNDVIRPICSLSDKSPQENLLISCKNRVLFRKFDQNKKPEYSLLPDQRKNQLLFLWSGNRLYSGLWPKSRIFFRSHLS